MISARISDIETDDKIYEQCGYAAEIYASEKFDIIVTENLYDDTLSDLVSGLIGSHAGLSIQQPG